MQLPREPSQGSAPPAPAQACVPVTRVPGSADLLLSVPGPAWGSKESRYCFECDIQDQAAPLTHRRQPDGAHAAQAPWARLHSSKAAPQLQGGRGEKDGERVQSTQHVAPRAMCFVTASWSKWKPDVAVAGSR